jgi:sulfur carrier protein
VSQEDRIARARAGSSVHVVVNGADVQLPAGATVADAVRACGVAATERGVAVALNREVVPRTAWPATPLPDGARVEVLRATAGG